MLRHTEDRIRGLCAELAATSDPEQQIAIVAKLREELHRYIEQLRIRLDEYHIEELPRTGIHIVRPAMQGTVGVNANSLRIVIQARTSSNQGPDNND